MPSIVRTQKEIDEQLDKITDGIHASKYPGMTYEQGAEIMYQWLTGETDSLPIEED